MIVKTQNVLKPRMANPAFILAEGMQALLALGKAVEQSEVPATTIGLVTLRASQINGCSVCVDMHCRNLQEEGETDERIFATAAWRDAPYFTEAERAALELSEAVTRLADQPDPVSDAIWQEAAKHYDEKALAALITAIALVNIWNRFNVATRQIAGERARSTRHEGGAALPNAELGPASVIDLVQRNEGLILEKGQIGNRQES